MDASELLAGARIVPVVVIDDAADAPELAEVLRDTGFGFIEITLRTPAAIECIMWIREAVPELVVGAGSVRSRAQMKQALQAGAQFAVSPGASDALIAAAQEFELPFVPGAVTASEVIQLLESGYRLQKFFPAELAGGVAMLEALGGPLPEARFFPTGGISIEKAPAYLELAHVACLGGSWIAPRAMLAARDFAGIHARAAAAVKMVARVRHRG